VYRLPNPLFVFSALFQSSSSSSSSFVLGRFWGGTSESPVACLLHSSFFHPANCLNAQPEDDDDDEDDKGRMLTQTNPGLIFLALRAIGTRTNRHENI
jgi:hypothetical protein